MRISNEQYTFWTLMSMNTLYRLLNLPDFMLNQEELTQQTLFDWGGEGINEDFVL